MISKEKLQEKQERARKVEKLENRIIINYGIAALAYLVLNTINNPPFNMRYNVVLVMCAVMLAAAIACYLLNIKFKKTANYGHMFIGFTLALFLPISRRAIGSVNINLYNSMMKVGFIEKITNTANAVKLISILGVVYLVGMTIFNGVLIYKENHKNKKTDKK